MTAFLYALGGYVAGSIPFAVIVSRILALPDPRTYGSKNIGATNVLRSGSRIAALLTLVGDAGKGWAAVIVARLLGAEDEILAMVGLAAFLGHVFPVWLRFRGGKGVATAAGVFLALAPLPLLAAVPVWGVSLWITGYVSLSSIIAVASFPVWVRVFEPAQIYAFWASVALATLIVFAHRANIRRLLAGTETRFGTHGGAAA